MAKKVNKNLKIEGAPKNAPSYFYIKAFKDKKWRFFTKAGKEVSEATVKRSKKKVYLYQKALVETKKGKQVKRTFVDKKDTKVKAGRKVKYPVKKSDELLSTDIMGYEVVGKFLDQIDKNRKVYLKTFEDSFQFSKNSAPKFVMFFNEVHSEFFNLFKEKLTSPILFIGYTEFRLNVIFDFDNLDISVGSGDFQETKFSELSNEEIEMTSLVSALSIKRALTEFKKKVKNLSKTYFKI